MNKSFIAAFALASAVAIPTAAFAQSSNGPLTRAEVKGQLVQIEHAGYSVGSDRTTYPAGIQAAEKRVQGQDLYSGSAGASYYGSSRAGSPSRTGASRGEANAYTHVNGIDYSRP